MSRADIFMALAAVNIIIFTGLATYVLTRSHRRVLSWLFAGICLVIVGYYVTGLYLFPEYIPRADRIPIALRLKWTLIGIAPAIYMHLVSYYIPASWRQHRRAVLLLSYSISSIIASSALFGNALIAGPLLRAPGNILGPIPGPLMWVLVFYAFAQFVYTTIGLLVGWRIALSPHVRHQISYLLAPTILIILFSILNFTIILTADTGSPPHEVGDIIILSVGFFFAHAVLQYGSYTGRSYLWSSLFFLVMVLLFVIGVFMLVIGIDRLAAGHTPFPYPIFTSIVLVILLSGLPVYSIWVRSLWYQIIPGNSEFMMMRTLDLTEKLVREPDGNALLEELLKTLCTALDTVGGYLALSVGGSENEHYSVDIVVGEMSVVPGDQVIPPMDHSQSFQHVEALLPTELEQPGWQQVHLYTNLNIIEDNRGLLALGARKNARIYSAQDREFASYIARQIEAAIYIRELRAERDYHLEAAHQRESSIAQLQRDVLDAHGELDLLIASDIPWIEIKALGPFQVFVSGSLLAESALGSDRARGLLAYLLWKGESGATREEILSILWPDRPSEKANNSLHVALNQLRQALEPELREARNSAYIRYERRRYVFDFSTPHYYDVSLFRVFSASHDIADLRYAFEIYRGEFMQDMGWALPSGVETERRELENQYIQVLQRLIDSLTPDQGEKYLIQLLQTNPLDERGQRRLIQYYLDSGKYTRAVRQAERWRSAARELGLDLSPQIEAYLQRIFSTHG